MIHQVSQDHFQSTQLLRFAFFVHGAQLTYIRGHHPAIVVVLRFIPGVAICVRVYSYAWFVFRLGMIGKQRRSPQGKRQGAPYPGSGGGRGEFPRRLFDPAEAAAAPTTTSTAAGRTGGRGGVATRGRVCRGRRGRTRAGKRYCCRWWKQLLCCWGGGYIATPL